MLGEVRSDHRFVGTDAQRQGTAEWCFGHDRDLGPRLQGNLGEIAQQLRVLVAHLHHAGALTNRQLGERAMRTFIDGAIYGGNRRAVWILRRIPERARHSLNEFVRRRVLQTLRFVMHAVPCVAEHAREVALQNAMPTNRAQRRASTRVGQLHPAIGYVIQIALLCQPAHHAGHRGRRHRQRNCHVGRGGHAMPRFQFVNRFEVVLDGRGEQRTRDSGATGHHRRSYGADARGDRTSSTGTMQLCRTVLAVDP